VSSSGAITADVWGSHPYGTGPERYRAGLANLATPYASNARCSIGQSWLDTARTDGLHAVIAAPEKFATKPSTHLHARTARADIDSG